MDEHYLTINDVARLLGVSHQLVRRLIKRGKLSAVRVGDAAIRVSREALEAYINSRATAPAKTEEK